jgi:hypothetical protein
MADYLRNVVGEISSIKGEIATLQVCIDDAVLDGLIQEATALQSAVDDLKRRLNRLERYRVQYEQLVAPRYLRQDR